MERTQHIKKQFIAIALVIAMVCTLFTVPNSTHAETGDETVTDIQEAIVAEATSENTYNAGTSECLKWVKSVYRNCSYNFTYTTQGAANTYGEAYCQYVTSTANPDDDVYSTIQPGMFIAVKHTNSSPECGHIGIYIGDGYVAHWIGTCIKTEPLEDWLEKYYTGYDGTNYLYWGYQTDILTAAASECSASVASGSTYDGTEQEPAVTVKYTENGTTMELVEGNDYTLSYSDNVDAGTGKVKITGIGIFAGYVTNKTFTISKASVSSATITLAATSYTYTGSAITPTVKKVKVNGTTLTDGTDYTVSYSNNTNATTAAVVKITGKGNYTGTKTKTFSIKKKISSSNTTVTLSATSFTYDGTSKGPTVEVAYGGETLTEGTDYTVSYSDNVFVGTGTVKVTGIGTYSGSISKTFTITEPYDASLYALVVGYTWTKSVGGETVLYMEPYSKTSIYFYEPATGKYYQAVESNSSNSYSISGLNTHLDFQAGFYFTSARVGSQVGKNSVVFANEGYTDSLWIAIY